MDSLSLLIPLTFALAACLLSLAAAFAKSEEDLVLWGASYGPRTIHEYWRLLTAVFLDTHYVALFINAFATFVLGRAVSQATGPLYFCVIYLGAGAAGILTGTLLQPQGVIFGTCLGTAALVGSLLTSHFFERRRQPTSAAIVKCAVGYLAFLVWLGFRRRLGLSMSSVEVALALGFAGPFFLRLSRQHVLAPITGVFVVLLGLRLAIGSLPSSLDRFELDASLTSLRLQTAHELKMIDEKFLRGEITDNELAELLTREVLAPSKSLMVAMESANDPSLDRAWIDRNKAELKFRSMSLETIIAVYAAKTNLLEADDLARRHSDQLANHLDRFWYGQLPALRTRELQIIRLSQDQPLTAQNLQNLQLLRVGLAKDVRTLAEAAAHLEGQNIEEWIANLKSDVLFREVRLPSSALAVSPQSDYVPMGLSKQISFRLERVDKVEALLRPYLTQQGSELQHLAQLKEFMQQMQHVATAADPPRVAR